MILDRTNRRSGLYAIVNTVNGHRYLGSTADFYNRAREHRLRLRRGAHHCGHLQNAWLIYGEDAFVFRVLALLERGELRTTESRLLVKNVDHKGCYNSGVTAEAPMLGRTLSAETRRLMSLKGKGRKKSAEHLAKIGAAHKGRIWSESQLANLRAAARSHEVIAKKIRWHMGSKRSDEARRRMSEAAKRRWTPEARATFGKSRKGLGLGRKHSAASVEKMKCARREWWARASDEIKQKRSESVRRTRAERNVIEFLA